jgi:hypothetical protein
MPGNPGSSRVQPPINAVTGDVPIREFSMSGNATYQALDFGGAFEWPSPEFTLVLFDLRPAVSMNISLQFNL